MRTPGTIEPVYYFRNGSDPRKPIGWLMMSPYSEMSAPQGWVKEAANTLAEVDRLERTLYEQCKQEWEREAQREEEILVRACQDVQDRLRQRLLSCATDEFEKDCIRMYFQARADKRKKIRDALMCRQAYLWARHNDTPRGRGVDEEKVSVERIG